MIPRIDFAALRARDPDTLADVRRGAEDIGFLTLHNTPITQAEIAEVLAAYRDFFALPDVAKEAVNMARTGSNRGWGAPGSEQVDPEANPDYKQVFDCGYELPVGDPFAAQNLAVYAPNLWPVELPLFRRTIRRYYGRALDVSRDLLAGLAEAIGEDSTFFADKFDRPMALLRGNYYPARPGWAGDKDFGIARHTDYGCLTLLATDGTPGLEVETRDGAWLAVTAPVGEFVINFGEMLEMWTGGKVRATPHRVVGTASERLSVPLFFNPRWDTDVAPKSASEPILAGPHLTKRFEETYVHLMPE